MKGTTKYLLIVCPVVCTAMLLSTLFYEENANNQAERYHKEPKSIEKQAGAVYNKPVSS